jgi:hypothetical protein
MDVVNTFLTFNKLDDALEECKKQSFSSLSQLLWISFSHSGDISVPIYNTKLYKTYFPKHPYAICKDIINKSRSEMGSDEPKSEPISDKPISDEPRSDEPRSDKPRSDEPRSDEPRSDEPRSDEPRSDEPRSDEPISDEPISDKPRSDKPRSDKPRSDEPRSDEPRSDEPRSDEPRSDEPRSDEPRSDEPRSDEPRSDEPRSRDNDDKHGKQDNSTKESIQYSGYRNDVGDAKDDGGGGDKLVSYNGNNNTDSGKIRVMILAWFCSAEAIREFWNKMTKGDYTWNNIVFVLDNPDYYVIINKPNDAEKHLVDPAKSIIFHMEPRMEARKDLWGEWACPDKSKFLRVYDHQTAYNNLEWHLSKSYTELLKHNPEKTMGGTMSTCISNKYHDVGHIKRIDFCKFLDTKDFPIDVYGGNRAQYKRYKGALPPGSKDDSLFPYKYTFNAENHMYANYMTEKIVDAILSECFIFYCGASNIDQFIDRRAYMRLDLENFENDYKKIVDAIERNIWEERISVIRYEKQRILNEMSFCPRLEKILGDINE